MSEKKMDLWGVLEAPRSIVAGPFNSKDEAVHELARLEEHDSRTDSAHAEYKLVAVDIV